ncbi:hypothetical protein X975_07454, partial [Stegodyphus mimosarum]
MIRFYRFSFRFFLIVSVNKCSIWLRKKRCWKITGKMKLKKDLELNER